MADVHAQNTAFGCFCILYLSLTNPNMEINRLKQLHIIQTYNYTHNRLLSFGSL